jgi:formate hydrogenlyase subunit 4
MSLLQLAFPVGATVQNHVFTLKILIMMMKMVTMTVIMIFMSIILMMLMIPTAAHLMATNFFLDTITVNALTP